MTASTGNVGREVVGALRARGLLVRAADRDPARVGATFGGVVDAVPFDFTERRGWAAAVRDCDGVFLLRPPAVSDMATTLNPFIDVARAHGARHVVFLSVAGAGANRLVPHHRVERHLRAGGAGYTILRPGFFAQNLQDAYRRDIVEDDRLYVPAGAGRVAFVDVRDVATVAARIFAEPGPHERQAYTLTGPAAVTFADAARLLTGALGRTIRYEPASVLGYLRHLRRRGLPRAQALVQAVLHVGLRWGQAAAVDPTLGALLGGPAGTLERYIADHHGLWRR